MQRNKKIISFVWLILPVILAAILWFKVQPALTIIPSPDFTFVAFSDLLEGGGSEASMLDPDTGIVLTYMLREGYQYPYAGAYLNRPFWPYLDLSDYNRIRVSFKSSASETIRLYLKTYQTGITNDTVDMSQRYNILRMNPTDTLRTVVYTFSETFTPDWWYQNNGILGRKFGKPDFSKVTSLVFNSDAYMPNDVADSLTVTELTFLRDRTADLLSIFFFLLIYYGATFGVRYYRSKRNRKDSRGKLTYKLLTVKSQADEDIAKISEYVGSHFSNSDLTVEHVAQNTGISMYRIPGVLKEKSGLSFKEYVNKIRLEEAKRLLLETDRQVTEIAQAVGYNSIPHFNRVFKLAVGTSPLKFRKQDCADKQECAQKV